MWVAVQLTSERDYEALIVAIASFALGGSLTANWAGRGGVFGQILIAVGSLAFAVALGLSLAHRYFTYGTHKEWIRIVDAEFDKCASLEDWKPGAMKRATEKYDSIRWIKAVDSTKPAAGIAVSVGAACGMLFLWSTLGTSAPMTGNAVPTTQPAQTMSQVVTVYSDQTRPSNAPSTQRALPTKACELRIREVMEPTRRGGENMSQKKVVIQRPVTRPLNEGSPVKPAVVRPVIRQVTGKK